MSDVLDRALLSLPHGPEFRFVDLLIALDPGKHGVGECRVRGDEPFLKGHFPGEPLFPGVLLLEAIAQLAGVVAQSDPAVQPIVGLKLAAVRNAKISGSAKPGEVIVLEATILRRLGPMIQATGKASVNGRNVVDTEIVLAGG